MKNLMCILGFLLIATIVCSQSIITSKYHKGNFHECFKPIDMNNPDFNYEIFEISKVSEFKDYNPSPSKSVKQVLDSSNMFYNGNTNPEYARVFFYDEDLINTESQYYYADDITEELEIGDKNEYTYNENNLILSNIFYVWDDVEGWTEDYKLEYEYDLYGNMTCQAAYTWNTDWIPNNKSIYEFDENGYQTLYIYFNWNTETESWIPVSQEEYEYNEEGLFTFYASSNYDNENSIWVYNYKYEYSYNEQNLMSIILGSQWDSEIEDWVISNQQELSYDENNNHITTILKTWDSFLGELVNYFKYEYEYNELNINTVTVFYEWSEGKAAWVATSKYEYTYDTNNLLLTSTYYSWHSGLSDWRVSWLDEYTYDTEGNTIQYIYSTYNEMAGVLVPSYKEIYNYNLDYSFADIIIPYEYSCNVNKFKNMLLAESEFEWNPDSEEWQETQKYDYYYSEHSISDIVINEIEILSIYPNPIVS
ncbi:MAG: hypothetical protein PHW83_09385 [Bacteroidales bacterium]|nr:hypothetical protein [Bacteroidales bacterium]